MAADRGDRLLIREAMLLTEAGGRSRADLLIAGGVVRAVGDGTTRDDAALVLHANGLLVVPGFIDVHVHGAGGDVFEQGSGDGNARISALLARYGTVGMVATLAALPADDLRGAVAAIAALQCREPGARIVGIHLEGPYLNPRRCGAQNPAWMRRPSVDEFDALQTLAGGLIRMVTVAPELDGALAFIRDLRQRGVTVAIGHTEATAEQVEAAIVAGVTHVTHVFNAMAALHHREPGPVGVALTDDSLTVEVICDGHHLSPRTVDIVFRCKAPGRVVMVSDAVAAGLPDGEHRMFGVRCVVSHGTVRTQLGRLAGSCLTLDAAVRNLRQWQPHRPLAEILACVSAVPARIVGRGEPATVVAGAAADLVCLTDDMRVAATVVNGRCVWRNAELLAAHG